MAGEKLLERRLRMVLDFEVGVEELTDEWLREYYGRMKNFAELIGDSVVWENLSRQSRLQGALLEDEGALLKYLTYVTAVEVDASSDSRLCEVFGVGREGFEREVFGRLFAGLDEEDEKYYRLIVGDEAAFYHSTEALTHSVKGRLIRATLEEVRPVAEPAIDEVESDNLSG